MFCSPAMSLGIRLSKFGPKQQYLRGIIYPEQDRNDRRRGSIEDEDVIKALPRIEPISRSAWPFCQGDRGAVGLSRRLLVLLSGTWVGFSFTVTSRRRDFAVSWSAS
jgi:hypothetical protein